MAGFDNVGGGGGDEIYVGTGAELVIQALVPNGTINLNSEIVYTISESIVLASGVVINGNKALILKNDLTFEGIVVTDKHSVVVNNVLIVGASTAFTGDVSREGLKDATYSIFAGNNTPFLIHDSGVLVTESQNIKLNGVVCYGLRGIATYFRGNGSDDLSTSPRDSQIRLIFCESYHCHCGFIELPSTTALGDTISNVGQFYGEVLNYKAFNCRIAWWQSDSNWQITNVNLDACTYAFIGRMVLSTGAELTTSLGGYQGDNETGHGRYDGFTFNHNVLLNNNDPTILIGGVALNTTSVGRGLNIKNTMPNYMGGLVMWASNLHIDDLNVLLPYNGEQVISSGQFAIMTAYFNNSGGVLKAVSVESNTTIVNAIGYNDRAYIDAGDKQPRDVWKMYEETSQEPIQLTGLQIIGREIHKIVDDPTYGKVLAYNNDLAGHNANPTMLNITSIASDQKDSELFIRSVSSDGDKYSLFFISRMNDEIEGYPSYSDFGKSFITIGLFYNAPNINLFVFRMGANMLNEFETLLNLSNPANLPNFNQEIIWSAKTITIDANESNILLSYSTDGLTFTEVGNVNFNNSYVDGVLTHNYTTGSLGEMTAFGSGLADSYDSKLIKEIRLVNLDENFDI